MWKAISVWLQYGSAKIDIILMLLGDLAKAMEDGRITFQEMADILRKIGIDLCKEEKVTNG